MKKNSLEMFYEAPELEVLEMELEGSACQQVSGIGDKPEPGDDL